MHVRFEWICKTGTNIKGSKYRILRDKKVQMQLKIRITPRGQNKNSGVQWNFKHALTQTQ
jgi:hypothetical protein